MSDADAGWLLRHRDGVEHGPFRLADLVSAASAGNIALDTQVRHSVHTRDAWVLAKRVQPIAAAMAARPTPERAPPTSPPQPQPAGEPPETSPGKTPRTQPPQTQTPSPQTQTPPARTQTSQAATPRTPTSPTPVPNESIFRHSPAAQTAPAVQPVASRNPDEEAAVSPDVHRPDRMVKRDEAFPVPRTFLAALQVLVTDFRFRKFVTPWIVKILWAIAFGFAVLELLAAVYMLFVQPSMEAPGPRTAEGGGWEFTPLQGQSFFQTKLFIFFVWSALIALSVVCLRVLAELTLVFFRVSGDLSEVRRIVVEKAQD